MLNNFGTPNEKSDMFYIFLIFNKKGDISGEIYDLQNNALYSKSISADEINIVVEDCDWLTDFLDEAKKVVTEPYSTGFGGSGYNGSNYGGTTTPNHHGGTSQKRGAKSNARQVSVPDDNDTDDDDYYAGIYGRYGGYR